MARKGLEYGTGTVPAPSVAGACYSYYGTCTRTIDTNLRRLLHSAETSENNIVESGEENTRKVP
ncbi:hypothetical protein C7212DRAFT_322687 [Tuber magnatum]|uniref:Uncharacterized protein n=1 Tax=Tuber magnatum TaxID=42249 RepID=A0A317SLB6_9PEZI|nr:hypothetical protein C7212DRAFT_322687 [Tuber magnatum]